MTAVAQADLVSHTARFCRLLREQGLPATPGDTLDATRTLGLVDVTDREDLRLALRTVLVSRVEDGPVFDEAFDAFWGGGRRVQASDRLQRRNPTPTPPKKDRVPLSLDQWLKGGHDDEQREEASLPSPSALESLGTQDFKSFGDEALRDVTRVARRIARRLATRPSRRWQPARDGARPNLRRMLRSIARTGGEVSELAFRERKVRRTKLVVVADVSGSMDLYARLFLQFLFALQHSFARVETFVFATRLSRITEQLRARDYGEALTELSAEVRDWNGGTRIGESLQAFVQGWPRLLDRHTVAIVLSDGWETGDPEVLGQALEVMHRRAARVVWLNPLLGSAGYEPLTRGMQAAMPHIDVFAPAHDLASLGRLARHLAL
jgi:uncharacterized protein with von Willebrand factor type A (vWA) domain